MNNSSVQINRKQANPTVWDKSSSVCANWLQGKLTSSTDNRTQVSCNTGLQVWRFVGNHGNGLFSHLLMWLSPKNLYVFHRQWLTSVCFSQRRCHHRGPLLGLLLTAEVEADAVMWRRRQTQFVALGWLYLILYCPQIKLSDGLEKEEKS